MLYERQQIANRCQHAGVNMNHTEGQLAQADAELMRRLQRIRELEGELADQAERAADLEAMLADADEKREYWRQECLTLAERVRVEA